MFYGGILYTVSSLFHLWSNVTFSYPSHNLFHPFESVWFCYILVLELHFYPSQPYHIGYSSRITLVLLRVVTLGISDPDFPQLQRMLFLLHLYLYFQIPLKLVVLTLPKPYSNTNVSLVLCLSCLFVYLFFC